ncbi:MAG: hypothetical protein BWY88_00822 [Synergistetes bacterium ADurb.Bin520]|nr:MAG: hypothetical protein BWY88_00822 [Synergistetes bacterium ADurb.Bin520]
MGGLQNVFDVLVVRRKIEITPPLVHDGLGQLHAARSLVLDLQIGVLLQEEGLHVLERRVEASRMPHREAFLRSGDPRRP